MGFLIDSSVLIAAERQRISLEEFLRSYAAQPLAISSVTASELLHGVYRAQNSRQAELRKAFVEYILATLVVIPFDLDAARRQTQIWAQLQAAGTTIGAHDLMIAATALVLGYGVITINAGEFSRVPGLNVLAAR
jgi:tRNA(fMet)-specific endonuclease VapC